MNDKILSKLPPQSLEAEKGVLGSLMLDQDMCDEVTLILRADDFYADANGKLFGHLIAMHEAGGRVDALLLTERLKAEGDLEAVGGVAHLGEVAQSVPYAANATYYANIVQQKATMRSLIHASAHILKTAYGQTSDPAETLNDAEETIFAIRDSRGTHKVTTAHDLMQRALDRIDTAMEGKGQRGVQTGFIDLDRLTGGLHDSELTVLACRPAMGKTSLAMNIAEHATMQGGVPTLFVSLEMTEQELAQRMLSSLAHIDGNKFRSGFLSADDRSKLAEASAKLSQAPLFIDDTPSQGISEIGAMARRLKRKHNLGLLIIDYMQLIQPDNPKDPRQEQVAKMARRLKCLARELKIPVLCLAQLNRQMESGTEVRMPRLSHLRESGAIEQDADVVIFIHREEVYHTPEEAKARAIEGKAIIKVAKQRNGPTGEIKLVWFSQHTHFRDCNAHAEEEPSRW